MSKITTMALFIAFGLLLCHYAGLVEGASGVSYVLIFLRNPWNMSTSTWFLILTGAVTAATGTGIALGRWAPQALPLLIKSAVITSLFLIGWDLWLIGRQLAKISPMLGVIIIAPIMFVWALSAIEWWK